MLHKRAFYREPVKWRYFHRIRRWFVERFWSSTLQRWITNTLPTRWRTISSLLLWNWTTIGPAPESSQALYWLFLFLLEACFVCCAKKWNHTPQRSTYGHYILRYKSVRYIDSKLKFHSPRPGDTYFRNSFPPQWILSESGCFDFL